MGAIQRRSSLSHQDAESDNLVRECEWGIVMRYGLQEGSLCCDGYADESMETHIGLGGKAHRARRGRAEIDGSPRPDSLVVEGRGAFIDSPLPVDLLL